MILRIPFSTSTVGVSRWAPLLGCCEMVLLPDAACRGLDPALFYPDEESESYEEEVQEAKAVCMECPVRADCLALGMDEDYGIFGALTALERKLL